MNPPAQRLFTLFCNLNLVPLSPHDVITFSTLVPGLEQALCTRKILVILFFTDTECQQFYLTLSQIKLLATLYPKEMAPESQLRKRLIRGGHSDLYNTLFAQGMESLDKDLKEYESIHNQSLCSRITQFLKFLTS